jgi:hypothetical protein
MSGRRGLRRARSGGAGARRARRPGAAAGVLALTALIALGPWVPAGAALLASAGAGAGAGAGAAAAGSADTRPADRRPADTRPGNTRPPVATSRPGDPRPTTTSPTPSPSTTRPGTPTPVPARGPTPHIQPFAQLPGVSPQPRRSGPPARADRLVTVDGCDRRYGGPDECVPRNFPPGVTDRCAWLRARGHPPAARRGEDSQGLDRNGDGVACGAGD